MTFANYEASEQERNDAELETENEAAMLYRLQELDKAETPKEEP